MKKLYSVLVMALLVLSIMPVVVAVSVGAGTGIDIITEDFPPMVWMCNDRVVLDDDVEPGRMCPINAGTCTDVDGNEIDANNEGECISAGVCSGQNANPEDRQRSGCTNPDDFVANIWTSECAWGQRVSSYIVEGAILKERLGNYAFEGEQLVWDVIVFDKNGIEKIEDVFATIGDVQGAGNEIEVNCILDSMIYDNTWTQESSQTEEIWQECNARIGEEYIEEFRDNTAAKYKCILTVETPESMYGEYWITVEATDLDGESGIMSENEYWFLNPVIALTIEGDLVFDEVRPGTSAYSETLLIQNDADAGSGVLLDMFISGTDFYDSLSSGAKCPLSNQLKLGDGDSYCDVNPDFGGGDLTTDPFCYFATNGAYSSQGDDRNDVVEDYVGINYGIGFNNPNPFYGGFNGDGTGYEIIQSDTNILGVYFAGNILAPGGEMALTFRLNLPEPCNGDFDTGSFYFWGEAI